MPFGKLKQGLFIQLRFNMFSKIIRISSLEGFENNNMVRENALAETVQKIHCLFIFKVIRLLDWRVIIALPLWTFVY